MKMKKTYIQPTTEVVKIYTPQALLYTSQIPQGDPDDTDDEWMETPDSDGRLWGE